MHIYISKRFSLYIYALNLNQYCGKIKWVFALTNTLFLPNLCSLLPKPFLFLTIVYLYISMQLAKVTFCNLYQLKMSQQQVHLFCISPRLFWQYKPSLFLTIVYLSISTKLAKVTFYLLYQLKMSQKQVHLFIFYRLFWQYISCSMAKIKWQSKEAVGVQGRIFFSETCLWLTLLFWVFMR